MPAHCLPCPPLQCPSEQFAACFNGGLAAGAQHWLRIVKMLVPAQLLPTSQRIDPPTTLVAGIPSEL